MSSSTVLRPLFRGLALAAVALVAACGGDSGGPSSPSTPDPDPIPSPTPGPGPVSGLEGRAIFGLTCANQLVFFGSGNPEELQRQVQITGMSAGSVISTPRTLASSTVIDRVVKSPLVRCSEPCSRTSRKRHHWTT